MGGYHGPKEPGSRIGHPDLYNRPMPDAEPTAVPTLPHPQAPTIVEEPEAVPVDADGDHDRFAHVVKKDDQMKGYVMGESVTAALRQGAGYRSCATPSATLDLPDVQGDLAVDPQRRLELSLPRWPVQSSPGRRPSSWSAPSGLPL